MCEDLTDFFSRAVRMVSGDTSAIAAASLTENSSAMVKYTTTGGIISIKVPGRPALKSYRRRRECESRCGGKAAAWRCCRSTFLPKDGLTVQPGRSAQR